MLAKEKFSWRFVAAAPPREVFAVMEQMLGIPPYRYEVVSDAEARVIEAQRRGFFGGWRVPHWRAQWISCRAQVGPAGTELQVACSAKAAPRSRALQLVGLLVQGLADRRGIYRQRRIPPGPVSLVASWAGMGYRLFANPDCQASRAAEVHTATELHATGEERDGFVQVRLDRGVEGWVEKDQVVPAPAISTRMAQVRTAGQRT